MKHFKRRSRTDVFLLGAGFSKAIHDAMPTMADLSDQVMSRLLKHESRVTPTLKKLGNNIELWMTYLSQPQPWLPDDEQAYRRWVVGLIRQQIEVVLDDHVSNASKTPSPDWLNTLIRSWHDCRVKVLTLNYDTLVERAPQEVTVGDKSVRLDAEAIYPPYFTNILSRSGGALWGREPITTFRYLKLHGSTNWYYSGRTDFYGETIFYGDVGPFGKAPSPRDDALHHLSRDKELLIIPPVTDKNTYFNNETVRRLWRDAGAALKSATRVFIIGYSLPDSDLGMRFFLTDNQPRKPVPYYIIDVNEKVGPRYKKLLWSDIEVRTDFVQGLNSVELFTEQYASK